MKNKIIENLKIFFVINIIILISIFLGTFLLYLSYKIPHSNMEKNVYKSYQVFEKEGDHPAVINQLKEQSRLDNFTDALMLLNTITDSNISTLKQCLLVYRYGDLYALPINTLKKISNHEKVTEIVSYPRYWHGYLIVLKPLVSIFNYKQIRLINGLFQMLIISFVILLFCKRKKYKLIIPYILLILVLMPPVIFKSLQYSTVWYIFNIGILFLLLFSNKINLSFKYVLYIFGILGAMTAYFDFYTYPIVTFGIPAIIYFSIFDSKNDNKIYKFFSIGFSWAYTYFTVWVSKWIIGTIFTDENVIRNALETAGGRVSNIDSAGQEFTRMSAVSRNIDLFFNKYIVISLLIVLFIFIVISIKKYNLKNIRDIKSQWPLIIIGMMPFMWYYVFGNHSYIHYWMTNKGLCVTYFAIVMIMINSLTTAKKEDKHTIQE